MAKKLEEKILDVDASMQGTITFRDPVNLRINGSFEGRLDVRGNLTIGENANVKADIRGDKILIAGKVTGNVTASTSLSLIAPAVVRGNVKSPVFSVAEGSLIEGQVSMTNLQNLDANGTFSLRDLAQYLEVEMRVIEEWAQQKKIPGRLENGEWKFSKATIDKWVQDEKVKL